jgi:hypothetical protein
MVNDFVFVDGWRLFSSDGNYIKIREKDLLDYRENGSTDEDIKAMAFSYLTGVPFNDFSNIIYQTYEF